MAFVPVAVQGMIPMAATALKLASRALAGTLPVGCVEKVLGRDIEYLGGDPCQNAVVAMWVIDVATTVKSGWVLVRVSPRSFPANAASV
jgi:hypothetical protein